MTLALIGSLGGQALEIARHYFGANGDDFGSPRSSLDTPLSPNHFDSPVSDSPGL